MRMKLGTRASALALTQSQHIRRSLESACPGLTVELVEISTTGDRVTGVSLTSFGGAGVFVKELEMALLDGRIDLAVHSLKDVPTRQPEGLIIGCIPEREDVRDAVISSGGIRLKDLSAGSRVGSGSPRRRAQLRALYPHLQFADIRGNVDTRIRKVDDGEYAATVLALAGLRRLQLDARASEILTLEQVLPAPGQGALGLECRSDDMATLNLIRTLHDPAVAACVEAERALLEALGGGCHLPLGALGTSNVNSRLELRCALGDPDGSEVLRAKGQGVIQSPRALGLAVAQELFDHGGRALIERLESRSL